MDNRLARERIFPLLARHLESIRREARYMPPSSYVSVTILAKDRVEIAAKPIAKAPVGSEALREVWRPILATWGADRVRTNVERLADYVALTENGLPEGPTWEAFLNGLPFERVGADEEGPGRDKTVKALTAAIDEATERLGQFERACGEAYATAVKGRDPDAWARVQEATAGAIDATRARTRALAELEAVTYPHLATTRHLAPAFRAFTDAITGAPFFGEAEFWEKEGAAFGAFEAAVREWKRFREGAGKG